MRSVHPPRLPDPPPLETNDVRTAAVGTALWAVALVVLLITGPPQDWWLAVCGVGIAIGLFAVAYVPRLQRAREGQTRPEDSADPEPR